MTLNIQEEDLENNNDRELIAEFLEYTQIIQTSLAEMESNNKEMRNLVNELITDKKSASNQK